MTCLGFALHGNGRDCDGPTAFRGKYIQASLASQPPTRYLIRQPRFTAGVERRRVQPPGAGGAGGRDHRQEAQAAPQPVRFMNIVLYVFIDGH